MIWEQNPFPVKDFAKFGSKVLGFETGSLAL